MKFIKKNFFNFSLIFGIFIIDRITKLLIVSKSESLDYLDIQFTSFLNFNLVWNNGIAFGLFSFEQNNYYNFITLIIIIITFVIIMLMLKSKGIEKLGFSMIIGGSFGNLFDRIYYSSVIDFIDFHINNFHWFIFNVADIFICVGVMLLIILEISSKKN